MAHGFKRKEGTCMIHTIQMETMDLARECDAACGDLTEEQEQTARDLIDCVSGKWSMWVLYELAQQGGPLRFSRLSERVEGISQKVLTQTLRQLERDGLVSRTLYPQVPPRVEYELTKLGRALLEQLLPLWRWVVERMPDFEAARRKFDAPAETALSRAKPGAK